VAAPSIVTHVLSGQARDRCNDGAAVGVVGLGAVAVGGQAVGDATTVVVVVMALNLAH
jgi:hypothetical protein